MKLTTILTGMVIVAITILSTGHVAAEDTTSLDIHSAVKLAPKDMQPSTSYSIVASDDLINWSPLTGTVSSIGDIIFVEPGGETAVSFAGASTQTTIFIDTEGDSRHFYDVIATPVPANMVYVPGGLFQMGDTFGDGEPNELPVHWVDLDAYYIDKYEVTNAEYVSYLNYAIAQGLIEISSGYVYKAGRTELYFELDANSEIIRAAEEFIVAPGKDNYPVRYIYWFGAKAYADYVGKRLPTEAEWEKAASWNSVSDTKTKYAWGNVIDLNWCNYNGYYGGTIPVGYFDGVSPGNDARSWYGCYDMNGNVKEWVSDWYSSTYYSTTPYPHVNPQGAFTGTYRVQRGGSWDISATYVRSAYRDYYVPSYTLRRTGFRCARSVQ